MSVTLASCISISNPEEYKVHLASWNKKDEPLDVFIRDRKEWDLWNSWRSGKDEFNRPFISL